MPQQRSGRLFRFLLPAAATLLLTLAGCGGGKAKAPSLTEQYRQALEIPGHEARAARLTAIGSRQIGQGDKLNAEKSAGAAATAAKSIEDPAGQATSLLKAFELYARLDQAELNNDILKAAKRAVLQIERPEQRLPLLMELCHAYSVYMDKPASARYLLEEAEPLVDQISPEHLQLIARIQLAGAWSEAQQAEQAENILAACLTTADGLEDARQRVEALSEAALTVRKMGRDAQAAELMDQAETLAKEMQKPLDRAHALASLARKEMLSQQPAKAKQLLRQAQAAAEDIGDPTMRSSLQDEIAAAKRLLD